MNALTKATRAKANTSAANRSNAPPPPAPLNASQIAEYLEYAMTALAARRAEIVKALELTAKAHPRIDDDETLGEVAENVRMANVLGRSAEDRRKAEKAPFLEGGRTVDGWFARFALPLVTAATPVQKAMNEYAARKEAKARADAEIARKAAEAEEQRRLDEAAAAMRAKGPDVDAVLAIAAEASKAAELAGALARGRASALTRTRGVYGASASVRTSWRWEVADISLVPREYLTVDEGAIKEAVRLNRDESGKPTIEIPGIRFVAEHKMAVR